MGKNYLLNNFISIQLPNLANPPMDACFWSRLFTFVKTL